ncbi:hypothetical protein HK103_001874 [Boothiomyces macroporosus]|uniref:Ubiquitin-like domain-containing protein n=1 Tax=Boothiomyces macroporosus TaxID=261099 RepID=A0AAD5Y0M8_9FUNG|nr:hypothetical protein HK103_001874 [Boothiomyces macroporosus]
MKEKPVKKKRKTSDFDFFDISAKPILAKDDDITFSDDDFEEFAKEPISQPFSFTSSSQSEPPSQSPKKQNSPVVVQKDRSDSPPLEDMQFALPSIDTGAKITIKVEFEKRKPIKFVVFEKLTFETLYIEVAKKLRALPTNCVLKFNGTKISPFSNPVELGIQDETIIQCEVFRKTKKKIEDDKEELAEVTIEFPSRQTQNKTKTKLEQLFEQLEKLYGPVVLEYHKTEIYRFTLPSSIGITPKSTIQCYSVQEYEQVKEQRLKTLASLDETEEPEPEENVKMNIKICFKQEKLNIKAGNETTIGEMLKRIQKKFQIKHLYFDGDLLDEDSTMEDLGVEDGDQLEAK